MIIRLMVFLLIFSMMVIGESQSTFNHEFQVNVTLSQPLDAAGDRMNPLVGTHNVRFEVINDANGQPIWSQSQTLQIDQGEVSTMIRDPNLDWVTILSNQDLKLRVLVLNDYVDIPFEYMPFSVLAEQSNQTRQFNDDDLIQLDYLNNRMVIQNATSNASLAVHGDIYAKYFVGDGSLLTNLTGPGFNDGHSLNSEDGTFKDVVFVSNTGNVGIHTTNPLARLHVNGNAIFRSDGSNVLPSYNIPSGSVLLWDPNRSAFRSGVFSSLVKSVDIGRFSMGFGEDIVVKSDYASALGGEDHRIDLQSNASVIIGGQAHEIHNMNNVVAGGFDHYVDGEWSVVFGGRTHDVAGEYNVVLGGENNTVDGYLGTMFGRRHFVNGSYNLIMGTNHNVTGQKNIVIGNDVQVTANSVFLYSDGSQPLVVTRNYTMMMQSKRGMGINRAPAADHLLSVSGNVKARQFVGDGRYLTDVILGQDLWEQIFAGSTRSGINYSDGPVSIGTLESNAQLTVSGGITIQQSVQSGAIENGTIQFSESDGLQLYHNDWISIDAQDTDTTLLPGHGFKLDDLTFNLDSMDANKDDVFNFNGSMWLPVNKELWVTTSNAIYTQKNISLADQNPSQRFPLLLESNADHTETTYPLVFSGSDRVSFSPTDGLIMLNIDYRDSTKSDFKMVNGQGTYSESLLYGATIGIVDNEFRFRQTLQPYLHHQVTQLADSLNLTPTGMYTAELPRVTVDFHGSLDLQNTRFDSVLDQPGLANKLVNNGESQFVYFSEDNDLNINSGSAERSQPIQFYVGDTMPAQFDASGNMIIGSGPMHERVTIHGGGVALGMAGSSLFSALNYGKQFKLHSISNEDPSIQFRQNDQIIMDIGHHSIGIGQENNPSTVLIARSINGTRARIESPKRSVLNLNHGGGYSFENNNKQFSINGTDKSKPYFYVKSQSQIGVFTTKVSDEINSLVIDGDMGLMNTSEIFVQNALKKTLGTLKKSSNRFQFQLSPSTNMVVMDSDEGDVVFTINNQSQLAINSMQPSADAAVFVNGDTVFKAPIFYEDMGKGLIQSFLLKTKSTDVNNQTEVRSVRSLIFDESSGLSYSVNKENQLVELYAPNYYVKYYESPRYDGVLRSGQRGYVEPNGKDIVAFREVYPNGGVSINVIDTDSDTLPDSIELYNPLIDGGIIEGTITLNGQLYVNGTDADGSEVQSIPFRWQQQLTHLTYASGNVGIDTRFPQTDLDVASTMGVKEFKVSKTAFVDSIYIQNESMTTVNQGLLFSIDADNTNDYDSMIVANGLDPLLSLKPKVDKGDVRVGLFTDDPQAMLHLKNDTATASVLMQALNSGYPVLSLNTSNQNKTGLLKMNLPVDSNEIGNINDSIIVADRSINFTTNGNIEPGLYVNDSSVSIGQDENENSLYVQSTAVVGEPFAGQLQLNSTTGLSIAGKLSVGHSMSSLTGGTVFAKDNLLVGQQSHELMPANLKGIYVERRLGVGIPKPQDAIAIQGGLKLKDKLDFYTDQSKIFSVKPREISVIPSNYGIDLNISKKMSFDVDNAPILSVVPEGVIIGDAVDIRGGDNSTTNNLIVSNNSGTANVLLDGKNGPPSVEFSTNAGAMVSTIGLRNVDSKTQLSIESNGSDLSAPDVVIISGKVGIGKTPGSHTNNNETKQHNLDVNGVVKSENLYINKDRMYPVPLGAIVMWTGSEADIPSGWQLCNGDLIQGTTDQYTPNLTDMFIKGASDLTPEKLNQTGGSHKIELSDDGAHTHVSDGIHAHVLSDDKHAHTLEVDSNNYNDNSAVVSTGVSHTDYDIRGTDGKETYAIKSNGHSHGLSASHIHGQDSQSKPGVHHLQAVSDTGAHTHKGGGHNHEWDNQPSFYVFAFIIKVSDQQF